MESLSGRVAVVTGGASGIGLALGRGFAAQGMKVVLGDIEEAALDAAVSGFAAGSEVTGVAVDVSKAGDVDKLRDAALDAYGAAHVICNNAGVSAGGRTWETTLDSWEWVLGVNLMGVVHGIRSFTPLLLEQDEGHIVNTASMAGLTSPPYMSIYNVSKHGVVTLSETLFGELAVEGSQVGVSVLCPGWVNTRIHEADRNRPGGPLETAPAIEGIDLREAITNLLANGLDPAHVADKVIDAVQTKRFYVLTHAEWKPMIAARMQRIIDEENPPGAMLPAQ
jgi:NAD(P)-dependent dehydrogenase (short-subunit alcohol dehydrogenase family)